MPRTRIYLNIAATLYLCNFASPPLQGVSRSFVVLQLYLLRPGFFFRQSLAVLLSRQEMIVERPI
nr:MAG TPA: hypothetical protein [Caudoviricetes sp.]